jgi:hypothetical protein
MDVFYGVIVLWSFFFIFWLVLCLPFKMMLQTAALMAILIAFSFLNYDPVLMISGFIAGVVGYRVTRKRPVPFQPYASHPFFWAPEDDVEFYYYAAVINHALLTGHINAMQLDNYLPLHEKMSLSMIVMTVGHYCNSIGWSLIAATGYLFFYPIMQTMPLWIGAIISMWMAYLAGNQIGMMMKRRNAEKILRREGVL